MCKRLGTFIRNYIQCHLTGIQEGSIAGRASSRMATIGDSQLENVQPIMVRAHQGHFAIVTSGMITNAITLRNKLEEEGLIFQGTSDAELIAHLIQIHPGKFVDKIRGVVQTIEGAYNFMIATKDSLYVSARSVWYTSFKHRSL